MAKNRKRKLGLTWTPAVGRAVKKAMPGIMGANLATVLMSNALGGDMKAHYDTQLRCILDRIRTIDTQLGILVKMLTLDPKAKMPVGFKMTWAGGRRPKRITPAGMFLRAVLAGVPFTVNGVAYRPVRRKDRKR